MRAFLGAVVGVIVVLAVAAVIVHAATGGSGPQPKSSTYQAVFLSNGQVYFGHLHHAGAASPTLTDIYYLQTANTNLQSGSAANEQVQLTKLGNELHGPEDEMVLNRSQILFWENLKESGKVVQAIRRYQGRR